MNTKRISTFVLSLILITAACKKSEDSNTAPITDTDRVFVSQASSYDSAEIRIANMALSKTTDSVIISFAQYMLDEHKRTRNDLKIMGTIVGFTVKDTLTAGQMSSIANLDTMSGRKFDSVYIHTRAEARTDVVNFFQSEIKNGSQVNVKAYATSTLERVKAQYDRADSITTTF